MHTPSWFAAINRTVSSTFSREPPSRHRGLAVIGPLTLATGSSPTAHSTRLSNSAGSYCTLRGLNGALTLMGSLTMTPSIELVMISPEIPIVRPLSLSLYPLVPRWLLGTLHGETHTVLSTVSWPSSPATDPPPFPLSVSSGGVTPRFPILLGATQWCIKRRWPWLDLNLLLHRDFHSFI